MDARQARLGPWVGGAILLGLVALMVVVAAARGTVVAGRPIAPPVPKPPEPGQCLLDDPFAVGGDGYVLMLGSGDELPSARTTACVGARFGEVVALGAGTDFDTSFDDGTWEGCWDDATEYLGLPAPSVDSGRHGPSVNLMTTLVGPDVRQRAAGQDWSACVVHPASMGVVRGTTVDHSLRDAWSRAEDRRMLALCLNDETLQYPVDCREPHGAEQVSSRQGDPARAEGADDCAADAVGALGSPAALDRGDLRVLALPTRWDGRRGVHVTGPDAVSADEPYVVLCLLVPGDASRMLVGPVRDLGDGPVPLE